MEKKLIYRSCKYQIIDFPFWPRSSEHEDTLFLVVWQIFFKNRRASSMRKVPVEAEYFLGPSKVCGSHKYLWSCDPRPSPYSSVKKKKKKMEDTPRMSRDNLEFLSGKERASKTRKEKQRTHIPTYFSFFHMMCIWVKCIWVQPTTNFSFCIPPLAAAVKLQAGPMINAAAHECKRRHLKSERPA